MEGNARIDAALRQAIDRAAAGICPPRLAEALEYAVFPGGHRIRPRLGLAVAMAHGDPVPAVADAALCSIELLRLMSSTKMSLIPAARVIRILLTMSKGLLVFLMMER